MYFIYLLRIKELLIQMGKFILKYIFAEKKVGAIFKIALLLSLFSGNVLATDNNKNIVVGIAFGSGAAKGFAHIGVIRALEENNIYPQIVVGTSSGSIVGSLYAAGYNSYQIEKIIDDLNHIDFAELTFGKEGFFKGIRIQQVIDRAVNYRQIQQLPIKFAAIATNFETGALQVFDKGDVGMAVKASSAVPGLFKPVVINGQKYVDGVLLAQTPVNQVRKLGANFVIAVDVSKKVSDSNFNYLSVADQSINILLQRAKSDDLKNADIVLTPNVNNIASFSFINKKEAIQAGYEAAMKEIPYIKELMDSLNQSGGKKSEIYVDELSAGVALSTGKGSDKIHASNGDDIINSGSGDDYIWANRGNDIIDGGQGNDTYYFSIGDGADFIKDVAGGNSIVFGPGISESDIKIKPQNDNLVIYYDKNTGSKITIGDWKSFHKISKFKFKFSDNKNFEVNGSKLHQIQVDPK